MAKSKSTKANSASPMDVDSDWRAESDLRTLVEAEKIKKDPKRLKACMKCKREAMKHMSMVGKK